MKTRRPAELSRPTIIDCDTVLATETEDMFEDRELEIQLHHDRETRLGFKETLIGGGAQRRAIFYDE